MKKTLSIIAAVLWCGVIFFFSSQNGDSSSSTSAGVLRFLYNIVNFNMTWEVYHDTFSLIIRKLAHFSEYFLLGVLLSNMFNTFKYKYYFYLAGIFGVLYAISDELHQLFSSGRACSPVDMLIDSCGLILGVLLFYLVKYVTKRKSA